MPASSRPRASAIAVAVAVLGVLVLARVAGQLRDTLDGDAARAAAEVARLHATTPQILTTPGALEGRLGGATLHVQVLDGRGRIVARSAGLGGRVLPPGRPPRALRERRGAFGDGGSVTRPIRVFAAPLGPLGRGPAAGGAVVAAAETQGIEDTIGATGDAVLIAGGVAALLAMLLAAALVRLAMRPLRALSAGAEDIARTQDAARRLAVPQQPGRGPIARGDAQRDAGVAGACARRRAALRRRRVARAAHAADRAARQRRVPGTPRRGPRGARRPARVRRAAEPAARRPADARPGGRDGSGAGTPVDLVEVAREALELHPGPAVLDTPGDGRVTARGDRAALLLAAGNLVGNARKHGPRGAPVTVRVRRAGRHAVLEVSDEGAGLLGRRGGARLRPLLARRTRTAGLRPRPGDRPRGRGAPRRRRRRRAARRSPCACRSQRDLKTRP